MKGKVKIFSFVVLLASAVCATTVNAGVISIASFSQPVVNVDFDAFTPGAITLGDIQSSYPSAGITSVSLACTGSTGSYGFSLSGNGLACGANGGFEVYSEQATYFEMTSITVQLDHLVTEIGFQHGDRTGLNSSLSFFSGGSLVETFNTVSNFNNNLLMLRSDTAFDSFTFFEPINWLVTELAIQTGEATVPVPVPFTLALFGLGLAGLGWSKRKKA